MFARVARPPLPDSSDVRSAIQRGTQFLLCRQMQSGLWRDFKTSSISDEWVSAFIAFHLLDTGIAAARVAAEECADVLEETQRRNGGWGYWIHQAPDADSTAWVLRLLQRLGRQEDQAFTQGMRFLQKHVLDSGGVCTYADTTEIALKTGTPLSDSFEGWTQAHVCVTGAAAPLLSTDSHLFLKAQQQKGHWSGYWWHDGAYPTAMAVAALLDGQADAAAIDAAQAWAATTIVKACTSGESNAFELAFCLKILCASRPEVYLKEVATGTRILVELQANDGWSGAARMRIPLPSTLICRGDERVHTDYRGNFTTAAVISALAASERILRASRIPL